MVASEDATPLWVKPLLNYRRKESENGHYDVLQRLVTPSPKPDHSEAEIETALETFVGPDGVALWRRVVVRSGPSCPKQVVHASYMLPKKAVSVLTDLVLCWTAFPERPDHQLLCVLATPTLLCIWDVYPEGEEADLGGEGHSIPLPFEASGIHSIGGRHGLMIQRIETMEDRLTFDAQNKTWTSTGLQGDDDDDGFVLKAPPRPVRLRESIGTSIGSVPAGSGSVPSLFSLSHPLDDVLPISNLPEGELHPSVVTDVAEKILFVGVLRWTDPNESVIDRKEYSQPICVTYHTHRKRYVKCPQMTEFAIISQLISNTYFLECFLAKDMLFGRSKALLLHRLLHLCGKSVANIGPTMDGTVIWACCSKIWRIWNYWEPPMLILLISMQHRDMRRLLTLWVFERRHEKP